MSMQLRITHSCLGVALGTALLTAATSASAWQDEYPSFRYGVQSVETQGAALTRYQGFDAYVQEKLGVDLDLYLSSEYAGVIQAIASGQIEVMDMGASGYAAAWIETNGNVEPLVVPQEEDGSIGYYAVMFVRADSDYESIEDLAGANFAWADPNSASGYLFPLVSLRGMGIEPEDHFGNVVFSGGHEQSIIGVLDGAYDAAVTWTNDVEAHTRGGIHMMLERGVLDADDIRIIWVSDLIPNPVIAIRSDVPQQMKDDLRNLFLNMHEDNPEVFREVARGNSPGYVEVDHEVYEIAIELRQQLAAERRGRR
ncbi:phosphonate transport system substrate-binding protein [Natronocella acetinitrilica]|uniref:Phosphonate transport system substrate-binding protein n=1 Tax=Natronocella acetinitrilica TaxID=414046 RepID=A0AAE3G759_9GAMM|nr:phosphate/phosphite/phosphonate ABC transporter substrate-binding protein [Natronocella acetinitrilica]MCP1676682.1 phosphonate transport system substrate-binding protein [Natronocella acetinitrilica]